MATQTGMSDEHYDIVSALYHALKGADTVKKYITDAEKEGDKEAAEFFKSVQDHNRDIARKATELLSKRVH